MKFVFYLAALSWIPCVASNAIAANPVEDTWNYDVQFVYAEFPPNLPNNAAIAVTYFMNNARMVVPGEGQEEEMQVYIRQRDSCGTENQDSAFISANAIVVSPPGVQDRPNPPDGVRSVDVNILINLQLVNERQNWWVGQDDQVHDFTLGFCIRTELTHTFQGITTSVAYDETNILVDITLTANFGPLTIRAAADVRQEEDEEAEIRYQLGSCVCTRDNVCNLTPEPFQPNQDLRVCVWSMNESAEMNQIQVMELNQQGSDKRVVVVREEPTTPLTIVQSALNGNGQYFVVETPLLAEFFDKLDNPGNIDVSGTALMQFRGGGSAATPRGNGRLLQEHEIGYAGIGEFELMVPYDTTAAAASKTMLSLVALFLASTAFLLV